MLRNLMNGQEKSLKEAISRINTDILLFCMPYKIILFMKMVAVILRDFFLLLMIFQK